MPTVSITISSAGLTRLENAMDTKYDYAANKINGETKTQFARRMVLKEAQESVVAVEKQVATNTARATEASTLAAINTDVGMT